MSMTAELQAAGVPVFDLAPYDRDEMRLPEYITKRARHNTCARLTASQPSPSECLPANVGGGCDSFTGDLK